MIKVLLLIPTLDRSGAEKQLTLLATRLERAQFSVHVAALTRAGPYAAELAAAGVEVTVLGKRFKFDPMAFWRLRRLIDDFKPDVLHTWLFAASAYGRLVAGRRPPFPVVVSERCVDSWKSGWQLGVDRRLAGRTARLIGNSQAVADFYRDQGIAIEKLGVIHNGIDVPAARDGARGQLRQELGIAPESHVVGFVGRLARQKRVIDLIWAFELLRVMHGEVVFVVAGDGPERGRLEHFARRLENDRRVIFLGHRDDASRLLPALDVFWLASDFEGLSNGIMEAMAAGLPVVASDIPPNRELVVPEQTGFLVPVGNRVAFAQLAERLLVDRALGRQFGTAGRNRIAAGFSVERMVSGYAQVYREVVAEHRRGGPEDRRCAE